MKLYLKLVLFLWLPTIALAQGESFFQSNLTPHEADSLKLVLQQTKNDTLKMVICKNLTRYSQDNKPDSVPFYNDDWLKLAQKLKQKIWEGQAYCFKAFYYINEGKSTEGLAALNEARKIAENEANEQNMYIEPQRKSISTPHTARLALLASLELPNSYAHVKSGDSKQAIEDLLKAIKIAESIKDEVGLCILYLNIKFPYSFLGKSDSALQALKKSVYYAQKSNTKSVLGQDYFNIGRIYLEKKDRMTAKKYFLDALNVNAEINKQGQVAASYMCLSLLFKDAHQPDSNIFYLQKALLTYQNWMGDNPEAYDDIYRDISKAYKEKGNMDSAYFYLDRSATIVNRRFDKDIENFKKYKDFYVAEQQKVKEAEKKNIQQQNYGLLAGLSLLSVIGLILYRNNRQKQKVNTILENTLIKLKETQNQLIEKEKLESLAALRLQKLRIAADMHDDIGSDLSALNLKAEMIRQKVKAGKQPMSEIDGLISFTSEIAKKVREVIWTVNARHDSLSSIINYFDTYADDFFEPTNIVVRTSLPPDIPQTDINGESRKILLMCFKESLNNVLKHAHASELKIVYAVENAIFSISIQDNGLGFDPSVLIVSHTNGNGLMNMQERMASIGGQCRIQTSPQGTEIVLLLPI